MSRPRRKSEDAKGAFEASMSVALGLGLGFFVLTAVASVLTVGLVSGYQNTIELLRQKAALLVSSEVNQTRFYLHAARDQVDFIVDQIERGEVEADLDDEFVSLMMGAVAATPQIVSLNFVDSGNRLTGVERQDSVVTPLFQSIRGDDDFRDLVESVREAREPLWGAILWREEYGQATLNYHAPVVRDGELLGVVTALISIERLSEYISDLETEFGANAFILYGRDHVLAHPLMAFGYSGLTRLNPLPKQAVFSDPILSSMWEDRPVGFLESMMLSGAGNRIVSFGEQAFVIMFHELEGYTDKPLIVGTHFPSIDLLSEAHRLRWAIILCAIISVFSALTAAYIGRQIARPVRRLAESAKKVHDLDLASVERIPGSFFRELNDAAHSFNTMLGGLRWFERYVPKTLVRRLMRLHGESGVETSYREVAILFTDIADFTRLSESMTAPEAADFLNHHFTMVARCVEAEEGTIDKFNGDSVMAIWGAPEQRPDFADRACQAALAMRDAIDAYNRQQQSAGGPRIRVRIGIHHGRVMVGNIGSPGRIDYTVVGDPVNVAQRLEELGKEIEENGLVKILISGALRAALLKPLAMTHLGPRKLRGRTEMVEVYRLDGPRSGKAGKDANA
jgi:class 3 adenylate cyclase